MTYQDPWDIPVNKHCSACFKFIDYSVNQKIDEGWFEWDTEPLPNMYACGYECAYELQMA